MKTWEQYCRTAKEIHGEDGVVEFDEFSEKAISLSTGGAWVKAWIWVSDEDVEIAEEA